MPRGHEYLPVYVRLDLFSFTCSSSKGKAQSSYYLALMFMLLWQLCTRMTDEAE